MKKLPLVVLTTIIVGAPLGALSYMEYQSVQDLTYQNANMESELNSYIEESKSSDALTVSTDITVKKESTTFDDVWTEQSLEQNAKGCGVEQEEGYFLKLQQAFDGSSLEGYEYTFTDGGASHTYVLFRNVPGYTTLEDFQKDFNICGVGGKTYPVRMNKNWLMFSESWGGGASVTEEDMAEAEALQKLQTALEKKGVIELN